MFVTCMENVNKQFVKIVFTNLFVKFNQIICKVELLTIKIVNLTNFLLKFFFTEKNNKFSVNINQKIVNLVTHLILKCFRGCLTSEFMLMIR